MTEFYDREKIYTGEQLRQYVSKVAGFKKRDCYAELQKFLQHTKSKMIFSFCGLRRTGKSTMLAQAICDMSPDQFEKACFIAAEQYKDMDELYHDIDQLYQQGYEYFFIDEITALPDFISRSAFLANKYGWLGKKIVLTGTDSLSFVFANGDSLFGRQDLVRTSYIPYHEFRRIIGKRCDKPDVPRKKDKNKGEDGIYGIDLYISYGGALVPETLDGNPDFSKSPFATMAAMGEYLNTAISGNILHSLKYDNSTRYEYNPLRKLEKEGILQNIINRVVAYYNAHLALEHLAEAISLPLPSMHKVYSLVDMKDYHPVDQQGFHQYNSIETLPEPIKSITKNYLESLRITESIEDKNITKMEMNEIEWFLESIGLLRKINLKTYTITSNDAGERCMEGADSIKISTQLVLMQPGMQYCIAQTLVDAIKEQGEEFIRAVNFSRKAIGNNSIFTPTKLNSITQNILNDIQGKILENIVLVETAIAAKKISRFGITANKVQIRLMDYAKRTDGSTNTIGCATKEVDLAILDSRYGLPGTCRLFEVKHADYIREKQYENLFDTDVQWALKHSCNDQIVQRTVLYRGPSKALDNGIIYYNVEDFLCKLGEDPNFLLCDLKAEIERQQREAELARLEAAKTEQDLVPNEENDRTEAPCEDTDQYDKVNWCER